MERKMCSSLIQPGRLLSLRWNPEAQPYPLNRQTSHQRRYASWSVLLNRETVLQEEESPMVNLPADTETQLSEEKGRKLRTTVQSETALQKVKSWPGRDLASPSDLRSGGDRSLWDEIQKSQQVFSNRETDLSEEIMPNDWSSTSDRPYSEEKCQIASTLPQKRTQLFPKRNLEFSAFLIRQTNCSEEKRQMSSSFICTGK